MSHTNSGKVYFDESGKMHVQPPYVVGEKTTEQWNEITMAQSETLEKEYAKGVPDKAPPLHDRIDAYIKLSYMTDRDFFFLTPQQKALAICNKAAEKIDVELDAERHGSHGFYNMDSLRRAGPNYCRAYLMSIR
jgi:hypothetical protein